MRHEDLREWDAAYVLGMLSPEDRRTFERHLATCDICTAAVAGFAGMPGILGGLTAAEATALLTSPAIERPGTGTVQHPATRAVRRRRRSRGFAVLAGVVALAVAASAFFVGSSLAQPHAAATVAMTAIVPGTVTANITVEKKEWGTRFDWNCSYGSSAWEPGDLPNYDLVVTDAAGATYTVATWSAAGAKAGNLSASTSVPTDSIRSVDIRVSGSATKLAELKL